MSLSDPKYLAFLAVIFVLFYVLRPGTPRLVLLLAGSYVFYFKIAGYYAVILLLVTAIAYGGGLLLGPAGPRRRRGALFAAICATTVAPLIAFKYLAFLLAIGAGLLSIAVPVPSPALSLVLPIGISFFTFAALGYLIDVYLEVVEPERRPHRLGLFLAFFPLVTAGPIERAGGLLPQFDFERPFSSEQALNGLRLIFLGFVLKVVFADGLAGGVNAFYGNPAASIPLEKLFAVVQFAFYIYADFAGYSLIAIGSAKMLGLEVRPNFRQPFLSTTIPEFWRTWHMSLSSWVRDYLFTPLRMRWRSSPRWGMTGALMLSFLILGVWHGAGWGFVVFGLMHGTLAVISTLTLARRNAFWAGVGMPKQPVQFARAILTFFLVALAFVPYRANSMGDAWLIYKDIFSLDLLRNIWYGLRIAVFHPDDALAFTAIGPVSIGWVLIALLIAGDILARRKVTVERLHPVLQGALYNVGIGFLLYKWVSGSVAEPFLYYRF